MPYIWGFSQSASSTPKQLTPNSILHGQKKYEPYKKNVWKHDSFPTNQILKLNRFFPLYIQGSIVMLCQMCYCSLFIISTTVENKSLHILSILRNNKHNNDVKTYLYWLRVMLSEPETCSMCLYIKITMNMHQYLFLYNNVTVFPKDRRTVGHGR